MDAELIRCAEALNREKTLDPRFASKMPIFSDREAILIISDWHFGLTTDNIWNKYNVEIADKRIQMLATKTMEKIERNDIRKLHIALLGDLISGSCHQSIRVQNSENSVEQLMNVSERIAELISCLADEVEETIVYSTYGNHARVIQNYNDSIHSENMERIIPFWLKQRLKHREDISISDSGSHELLRICACGHEVAAVHGDLDAGKNGSMLTMSILYEKNFSRKMEYMILGHWHKRYTDENLGIEQIGVGSLCGTDEYAKNKRLFSKPSQTLLIFDADGLDSICNIDLCVE